MSIWHDRQYVYEALGLNENGELPTIVDEARERGDAWYIVRESIEEMEKSGLFSQQTINFIREAFEGEDEDYSYLFTFEELEQNENEVTEEQIDYLNTEI